MYFFCICHIPASKCLSNSNGAGASAAVDGEPEPVDPMSLHCWLIEKVFFYCLLSIFWKKILLLLQGEIKKYLYFSIYNKIFLYNVIICTFPIINKKYYLIARWVAEINAALCLVMKIINSPEEDRTQNQRVYGQSLRPSDQV